MEKLYRLNEDGTYELAGYTDVPDLSDGIWLVQNKKHSRGKSSLVWRVGDLNRPVDVATKTAFYSIMDEIAHYIVKLNDPESKEFLEAAEQLHDDLDGHRGYGVYNIAPMDYATLILNKISEYFEETVAPPTFWEVLREFMNENHEDRKIILKTIDFLEENGYSLKKMNRPNE